MARKVTRWGTIGSACVMLTGAARAQCAHWTSGFGLAGTDGSVFAMRSFDGGGGARLFVGGSFTVAGDASARNIASWNGSSWSEVGTVPNAPAGAVFATEIFDDGSGPALYAACGAPQGIVRWDGTSWSQLPSAPLGTIWSLATYDDGSGPALYVGGAFASVNGVTVNSIARWNGASWSALLNGVSRAGGSAIVNAMTVHDDGSGPALYVGGEFDTASGTPVNHVARWNGTSWSALGSGMSGSTGSGPAVRELASFTNGAGASGLYAGGDFTAAGGTSALGLARWNGTSWTSVGSGVGTSTSSLRVHDDGSGPALYVGGVFGLPSGPLTCGVMRWNGTTWSTVGAALPISSNAFVQELEVFDAGSGPRLYAGGAFSTFGSVQSRSIVEWDGSAWLPLGSDGGCDGFVNALVTHDDGGGEQLYAGGAFASFGGTPVNGIARFDGAAWSPVGAVVPGSVSVTALARHDEGVGVRLFAGGFFSNLGGTSANGIARWDGSNWSALGPGLNDAALSLVSFDDGSGPALFAAGRFTASGFTPLNHVARWSAGAWTALGVGTSHDVFALCVFDDGSGPALYAGGAFSSAGGAPANRIARWNGVTWTTLGTGTDGTVRALLVHDDGSGPALIVGGDFTQAGGVSANHVARWRNGAWSAMDNGVGGFGTPTVRGFVEHDEGTGGGRALYAVGNFNLFPGAYVARWDGTRWSALAQGIGGSPTAANPGASCATVFETGSGADLYVGGSITSAGTFASLGIARWERCHDSLFSFCAGDFAAAFGLCPCGNFGALGHGCANSVFADGARLAIGGSPSLSNDTLALDADGMPNSIAVFLQGSVRVNGGFGEPLFDGIVCVGGTVVRLGATTIGANAAHAPQPGNPSLSVRGGVGAPGTIRHYQVFYRNAAAAFCPPSTANWTNGVTAIWSP